MGGEGVARDARMAKRYSVRMSRHEVWPEGQTRASESPLTGRTDERAMKGRAPKTPSPPHPHAELFLIGFVAFVPFAAKTFTHFTIYTIKKFSSLITHHSSLYPTTENGTLRALLYFVHYVHFCLRLKMEFVIVRGVLEIE